MRLFGLIGYPLTHSFSKNYFTEKFKKEGLYDCRYENFELESLEGLAKIIAETPDLLGLNVTIPYKEVVVPYLDESNALVKQTSACNCIKLVNGRMVGFNTDVIGFERSLLGRLQPWHTQALILGTGGAAKAAEFVLRKRSIQFRNVSRRASSNNLSYEQLTDGIVRDNLLIVNASPVGMFPKINEKPDLPYEGITPRHLLFDLIYNPEKTQFLREGEERGAAIQNGSDMLIYQAEESWKIWNETVDS